MSDSRLKIKYFLLLFTFVFLITSSKANKMDTKLNPARFKKEISLKELLEKRFSCRDFQKKPLKIDDIATLLWATCGQKYDAVTHATRTIPSAGATYPLELYLVTGENSVEAMQAGVYHYLIQNHSLKLIANGDQRQALAFACLGQSFIGTSPASIVIAAKFNRTMSRYGTRGRRYVYMEAGSAAQNTYLSAVNLGLATIAIGAFDDAVVKKTLSLENDVEPLIVLPIGYPVQWEK